jgi:hypothetical protein
MNLSVKRRYFDFRQGSITLAPIMQFSNFLMLAYLTINDFIPFELFVPIFVISILISFTLVGAKFRKHQFPTDINMGYEKSTEAGITVYHMMKALQDPNYAKGEAYLTRMDYMKRIGEGKV